MHPHLSAQPGDRGVSLSAFMAVVVVCLLLTAGLVVDGGAKAAGDRRAEAVAAQAARAGVDAGVAHQVAGAAGDGPATHAARAVLTAHGVDGEVRVSQGRVEVSTRLIVPTTFLGLMGVDHLESRGRATAVVHVS